MLWDAKWSQGLKHMFQDEKTPISGGKSREKAYETIGNWGIISYCLYLVEPGSFNASLINITTRIPILFPSYSNYIHTIGKLNPSLDGQILFSTCLSSANHLFLWAMAFHGYVSHNQRVILGEIPWNLGEPTCRRSRISASPHSFFGVRKSPNPFFQTPWPWPISPCSWPAFTKLYIHICIYCIDSLAIRKAPRFVDDVPLLNLMFFPTIILDYKSVTDENVGFKSSPIISNQVMA